MANFRRQREQHRSEEWWLSRERRKSVWMSLEKSNLLVAIREKMDELTELERRKAPNKKHESIELCFAFLLHVMVMRVVACRQREEKEAIKSHRRPDQQCPAGR